MATIRPARGPPNGAAMRDVVSHCFQLQSLRSEQTECTIESSQEVQMDVLAQSKAER